jgi:Subunit ChlI of Mg-chelatase
MPGSLGKLNFNQLSLPRGFCG